MNYLAVDLGAESGRVMLGALEGDRLTLEEVHRFPNKIIAQGEHIYWDLEHLEREVFAGLAAAAKKGVPIAGISTDSWGVDYILLDREGNALSRPFCYRDVRNLASPPRVFAKTPQAEVYEQTGIQFMPINTLFQLDAERHANSRALTQADHLLPIADYFNARCSGTAAVEESMASTTQLYDPRSRSWSGRLLAAQDFPPSLFPEVVPSGTVLGPVTGRLRDLPAFSSAQVVATCSHDTGDAVAAVPASTERGWAYLSSGTWSLLGAELPAPIITEAAREAGFTHEVGLGGTIRFLKNIAGLWLLQECRRAWAAADREYTYEELTRLAAEQGGAKSWLDLRDARFSSTGDMPGMIADFCRETAQPVPATPAEFTRTIVESLALTYAWVLNELESLIGYKIETLHIVGGGTRNELLSQLSADATRAQVVTGPVEATAIGNVLIQALALGHLDSAAEIRRIVAASFPTKSYSPAGGLSAEARAGFARLREKRG